MEGRGRHAAGFPAPGGPSSLHDAGTTSATSPSICSPLAASTRSASTTSPRPRGSPAARCSATTRPRTPCRGAISTRTWTTCAICSPTWTRTCPIGDALRTALLAFNSFDEQETARHRQRMRVILETAALQAYSMTMYAGWRAVVAAFVAQRLGAKADDLVPQTVAWTMLGVALSAYEHWLADESVSLAAGAGRCVRHGQRRAADAGLDEAAEENS